MSIDNQYVRRYRQHIPFYKSDFPQQDRRIYWHHRRCLCDPDCIFGIPVVKNQYLMFVVEDDAVTDLDIIPFGGSKNSTIELCCLDDGDAADCPDLSLVEVSQQTLASHKVCVIDGAPIQFNYFRIKVPVSAACGLQYLKIIAYEGTPNERIFYSQPIKIYEELDALRRKLLKLNINDKCGIGGVDWVDIWQGWPLNDGYDVYLPEGSAASFIEEITEEEVAEDGKGNEIQIFEKVDWKYQFDTGLVPDHYAEIIKEITSTSNNAITIPDRQATHYVEISSATSTTSPDGDGCFMNMNVQYIINKYNKDSCCDIDDCECPQDEAINVKSYVKDQVVAEAEASFGDIYVVPDTAVGPQWVANKNKYAEWTSGGWVYTSSVVRDMILTEDTDTYYLSLGPAVAWTTDLLTIINMVYQGSCLWDVFSVIPHNSFAKIQIEVAGSGIWNDATAFLTSDDLLSGTSISVSIANNMTARLVPLDAGCNLVTGPEFPFIQVDNCV